MLLHILDGRAETQHLTTAAHTVDIALTGWAVERHTGPRQLTCCENLGEGGVIVFVQMRQRGQVQRATGFRTGTGQAAAAERLTADHRTDLVAIDVDIADVRATAQIAGTAFNTGVQTQRQAITLRMDVL